MSAGQEKERRRNGKEGVECVDREEYDTKGDDRNMVGCGTCLFGLRGFWLVGFGLFQLAAGCELMVCPRPVSWGH